MGLLLTKEKTAHRLPLSPVVGLRVASLQTIARKICFSQFGLK